MQRRGLRPRRLLDAVWHLADRDDAEAVIRATARGWSGCRGVEFVSDVLEFPWGCVAQFQDPDGNRLQIREGRR